MDFSVRALTGQWYCRLLQEFTRALSMNGPGNHEDAIFQAPSSSPLTLFGPALEMFTLSLIKRPSGIPRADDQDQLSIKT
jgi:hypothetical protein